MGLKAKFWDCLCNFFLSMCISKPIRILFGSNPKVSHPKIFGQYAHPKTHPTAVTMGTRSPFDINFEPNFTEIPECVPFGYTY